MSKYLSAIALILFVVCLTSSCGSSNGCRGGGWYGDRNLTSVTPEKPNNAKELEVEQLSLEEVTSD